MAATFSYAQAAKGVAPSVPSAKTTSEPNNVSKPDEQDSNSTSQAENALTSQSEAPQEAENTPVNSVKESETTAPATKASASGTTSPSAGNSTSTEAKDEGSNTPNGTSESTWDKQSQASGSEKPQSGDENPKEKSAEDEKEEPPKELKAAPLPAVNVWQKRKEAQEAKAKTVQTLKPAPKNGNAKTASAASSISGDNQQEQPKAAPKKKGADAASEGNNRKRMGRDENANVPPVEDAALWPTPQVAQGEEKKKAQEKGDKSEKSPVIRPHGKEKWMPVPYVPTAVFNTPLPSSGRRGGRTARGGREGGRNGAHAAAADKAASGQAAQGSAKASPADRGRNEANSARANSLPAPSRRSNSADAGSADQRKAQTTDRSRGSKGAENANAAPAGRHANGGETFPRHHRDAKAFRNHDAAHKGGDHGARNSNLSVDAQAGPRSGSSNDRRFENGPKSADFSGFQGDRKDKEFSRESRADRGRGSRGRGGFGGSQNSHFANNHMSHNSFMHQKSFGFNDRQRSHNGVPNGSQGHRMSLRSPSLPNSATMYGVYQYPADINTMYGYQPMHAGPMTAVPYQQYMEPFSLMSMVSMQLEYYFSVDNLCKDLFLRKHMDSQGFVELAFIASFKRIKSLTEDFEFLRHVSRQLRNVEYITGEDGLDRLRPREWEQWVLPLEKRDPSAQKSGTAPAKPSKTDENAAPQNNVEGAVNGTASQQPLSNGTAVPKTSLSTDAPEFSPSKPVNEIRAD
ncbi:La domain family [Aspergillus affinis]|uniref:La domain family n=1 Tax=Aspergillus affinis TaxID=1070780 RepID=UPI0022FE9411|nr:uncharacterized protein KD926_002229 [Aspergillus affinis]KAI9036141.1 hypothetical protein KD926_002229 [Aspergillus affinis]